MNRLRRLLHLVTIDPSPLRRREFRLLFIGQTVTLLGTMFTYVAVPFQVYRLTASPLAVGLLGLAEILPVLALAFLGGALADARERRGMVLVTELAAALSSAVLVVNALLPEPLVWLIYAVAAAQGGLYALQRPSLDALLPRIVPPHELAAASALATLRGNFGMLLGPALAGVLIATIGLPATYAVDGLSFLVSAVAVALMQAVPPAAGAEQPSLRRVVEGLQYARTRQELIGTYVVDLVAMFFGMPTALFPAVADAAEVSVSPDRIKLNRIVVAHDCGLIINPDGLRNQIEGNVIQSASRALLEQVTFDNSKITSVDWRTYPILTFQDIPAIDIILINHPDQPAWGAGEVATLTTPPAIANAIFHATGNRLRNVPLNPGQAQPQQA